jgi:hypothetical protein
VVFYLFVAEAEAEAVGYLFAGKDFSEVCYPWAVSLMVVAFHLFFDSGDFF